MKFQVEYDTFTEAVTWVARTIPNRPAIPVLAGMKITAKEEEVITLGSRDSDISSHIEIDGEVLDAGEILVNGKLLADICRNLPNKAITFSLEDNKLEIECGTTRFSMKIMTMDDYSELPEMPEIIGKVDGSIWEEAVSQVSIAASHDDTLPMLVSICIEISGNQISLLATDRYRLALRELAWEAKEENLEKRILVRSARLLEIAKSLGSSSVNIHLDSLENPSLLGFSAAGKQNTVQLTDGEYPQVRSLFPTEVEGSASVDREEMLNAIKRSRLVVEKNSAVRLSLQPEELVIEAGQGEVAQASEVIGAKLAGEEIKLAFNPVFLQDALSVIKEENMHLSYTQATKPVVISGENAKGEVNKDFSILLMPIRTFGEN